MSADLSDRVTHQDSSVHHGGLRPNSSVQMLIMHTTDGDSAQSSIDYLNTTDDKTASYHYVIDRDGSIIRMTNPNLIAYHAGDSAWPNPVKATAANPDRPNGGRSVNRISIGIAWANKGEPLTDAQVESGLWLCGTLATEYGVLTTSILGHYQVSPGRKTDPLPAQDMDEWRRLLTNYMASR